MPSFARVALMKSAHRCYRAMNKPGMPSDWSFARCLRLAHAEIAGRDKQYATYEFLELQKAMKRLLAERKTAR